MPGTTARSIDAMGTGLRSSVVQPTISTAAIRAAEPFTRREEMKGFM